MVHYCKGLGQICVTCMLATCTVQVTHMWPEVVSHRTARGNHACDTYLAQNVSHAWWQYGSMARWQYMAIQYGPPWPCGVHDEFLFVENHQCPSITPTTRTTLPEQTTTVKRAPTGLGQRAQSAHRTRHRNPFTFPLPTRAPLACLVDFALLVCAGVNHTV